MVRARLHLICGNCGSPDNWEWHYIPEEVDEGEIMVSEDVAISCKNCSTIHSISSNAEKELCEHGKGLTAYCEPCEQEN